MKTYIFAFKNNLSEKIIKSLEFKNSKKFYLQGIDSIKIFAHIVKTRKPDFILGFGKYSKNSEYFHIEKYCSNKFKGKIYGSHFEKLKIPTFLDKDKKFKLKSSNTIGTSYCNFASYLITKTIYDNKLPTKFTFLHIPKNIKMSNF